MKNESVVYWPVYDDLIKTCDQATALRLATAEKFFMNVMLEYCIGESPKQILENVRTHLINAKNVRNGEYPIFKDEEKIS